MQPDPLSSRQVRLTRVLAEMDQVRAALLGLQATYKRLTGELDEIGAEVRAEMKRDLENANA